MVLTQNLLSSFRHGNSLITRRTVSHCFLESGRRTTLCFQKRAATQLHFFSTRGLRRPRNYKGPNDEAGNMPNKKKTTNSTGNHQPHTIDQDSLDRASLSPWVPIPDVVARRLLEMAQVDDETVHVDLGSGDGRVCFHALQQGVASTVGIDVDETIVQQALERLAKRHPPPDNIEFIVADLLSPTGPTRPESLLAWQKIRNATVITMYFATPGLNLIRPLLERELVGRTCKIITAGYEMPGWESTMSDVILGTQIHLYDWGQEMTSHSADGDNPDEFLFPGDDELLKSAENDRFKAPLESDKFAGSRVIDRTGSFPVRGVDLALLAQDDEGYDTDDENFIPSDDEEDDDEEYTKRNKS